MQIELASACSELQPTAGRGWFVRVFDRADRPIDMHDILGLWLSIGLCMRQVCDVRTQIFNQLRFPGFRWIVQGCRLLASEFKHAVLFARSATEKSGLDMSMRHEELDLFETVSNLRY